MPVSEEVEKKAPVMAKRADRQARLRRLVELLAQTNSPQQPVPSDSTAGIDASSTASSDGKLTETEVDSPQ